MNADAPTLRLLPAGECLRRLRSVPVGRIAYTKNALPAVEPVKFALDGRHIVIRIDPGSALATALHHTVVAFEADYMDYEHHCGWSVTIVGNAHEVVDPREISKLRAQRAAVLGLGRRRVLLPHHAGHRDRPGNAGR